MFPNNIATIVVSRLEMKVMHHSAMHGSNVRSSDGACFGVWLS